MEVGATNHFTNTTTVLYWGPWPVARGTNTYSLFIKPVWGGGGRSRVSSKKVNKIIALGMMDWQ